MVGDYALAEHIAMDVHFIFDCAEKVKMAYLPRRWGNFRLLPGTKTANNQASGLITMREIQDERIQKLSWIRRMRIGLRWREIMLKRQIQNVLRRGNNSAA
jgi:hypothetical protein